MRFPGQYADLESAFSYNYFRDYDPSVGRYIQSDPIGLQGGANTYAYASANPLVLVDLLGLCFSSIINVDGTINDTLVQFVAGFGAGVSFGLTDAVRNVVPGLGAGRSYPQTSVLSR
ncbi:MAG: RHS repeat-associated core domain-containing protein [Gammaproteobacteria bacterium]|nr:RHS repeat-associated core domain-containing protein [Gammaproteobacteria bacterium]